MSRPRVLVIEDDPAIREVLCRALADYEVVEAGDAEGALDQMVVDPADLLITDIALPRMDGCALAARVREHWPGVPVIAVSGYVGDRDVAEFEFDGFLEKPLELRALRDMVARLVVSER
jgi:CheY-like chemotaxis protein